jgi:hypothetical protein
VETEATVATENKITLFQHIDML